MRQLQWKCEKLAVGPFGHHIQRRDAELIGFHTVGQKQRPANVATDMSMGREHRFVPREESSVINAKSKNCKSQNSNKITATTVVKSSAVHCTLTTNTQTCKLGASRATNSRG